MDNFPELMNSGFSNNIVYLSPLGKEGIANIKKACIFFDKVFVPVTWTIGIINTLVKKEESNKWVGSIPEEMFNTERKLVLNELEPLINAGIVETDMSPDFHLFDKLRLRATID